AKVESKRPEAPKSRKNEDSTVRDLEERLAEALKREAEAQKQLETRNRELAGALEQQTATSEILRIIAASLTGLPPVLNAIAENAARVCGATDAVVHLVEGDEIPVVAHYGPIGGHITPVGRRFPRNRDSVVGTTVIDGKTIHIEDIEATDEGEFPLGKEI